MGEIIYNGRSSRDFGIEVETFPSYTTPKRNMEKIHIPGRNGDLSIDGGSWENGTRSYIVAIGSYERDYYEMGNKLSEWLNSSTTYARLEDSYEPDVYRLAIYANEMSFSNIYNHGGEAELAFDCKPQRFLKVGERPISFTKSSNNIQNPTGFAALPLFTVYGTGSGELVVGTCRVTISDIGGHITIDSDLQDAYHDLTNRNSMIKVPNGFPVFGPGITTIGFSGGVTNVEVIPRWFTL